MPRTPNQQGITDVITRLQVYVVCVALLRSLRLYLDSFALADVKCEYYTQIFYLLNRGQNDIFLSVMVNTKITCFHWLHFPFLSRGKE